MIPFVHYPDLALLAQTKAEVEVPNPARRRLIDLEGSQHPDYMKTCGNLVNLYQPSIFKANHVQASMLQADVLNEVFTCGDLDVLKRLNVTNAKLTNTKELLDFQEKFREKEVTLSPIISLTKDPKQQLSDALRLNEECFIS
mmetsp:Transcript_14112/g.10166  ORF Transcript_14112/g.10166 Transcript_14112/m.10166 type:complete len:142 (+) Transcript_14112:166-591(+)